MTPNRSSKRRLLSAGLQFALAATLGSAAPFAVAAEAYPAHLHLNLLPRVQGRGLGSALLRAWLDLAGPPAVHVGVNTGNSAAVGFWRARDFHGLEGPAGRTIWLGREAGGRPRNP